MTRTWNLDPGRATTLPAAALLLAATVGGVAGVGGMTGCSVLGGDGAVRFEDDVTLLRGRAPVVVLGDRAGSRVAVVPEWDGRVMTSSAGGPGGASLGWINRNAVASAQSETAASRFGGEDQVQLGTGAEPDGDLAIDENPPGSIVEDAPVDVTAQSDRYVSVARRGTVSGGESWAPIYYELERSVELLGRDDVMALLGVAPGSEVAVVAYSTSNRLTNTGERPWTREQGVPVLGVWGGYHVARRAVAALPFRTGPDEELGPIIDDAVYRSAADRLHIGDGIVLFRCDQRSGIRAGLGPQRALGLVGVYNAARQVLTIVQCQGSSPALEVWGSSAGDAPHCGVGGRTETAVLEAGASLELVRRTMHFQGSKPELDAIAMAVLGVSIEDLQ